MVESPKPIQMAILGPNVFRLELSDTSLVYGHNIYKYLEYLYTI
jgi:hypothetical protein